MLIADGSQLALLHGLSIISIRAWKRRAKARHQDRALWAPSVQPTAETESALQHSHASGRFPAATLHEKARLL